MHREAAWFGWDDVFVMAFFLGLGGIGLENLDILIDVLKTVLFFLALMFLFFADYVFLDVYFYFNFETCMSISCKGVKSFFTIPKP